MHTLKNADLKTTQVGLKMDKPQQLGCFNPAVGLNVCPTC